MQNNACIVAKVCYNYNTKTNKLGVIMKAQVTIDVEVIAIVNPSSIDAVRDSELDRIITQTGQQCQFPREINFVKELSFHTKSNVRVIYIKGNIGNAQQSLVKAIQEQAKTDQVSFLSESELEQYTSETEFVESSYL